MLSLSGIYYKILNLLLNIIVKSRTIPEKPVLELNLNTSDPIVYILLYSSKTELLTLRTQCLIHNLPDPLEPLIINDIKFPRYLFIYKDKSHLVASNALKKKSIVLFYKYLELHNNYCTLDIQIVLVSVMFGRYPKYEKKRNKNPLITYTLLNNVKKFLAVVWFGRDSFIRFSHSVSMRRIVSEHSIDETIIYKLARVAHMYFIRQHLATVGPRLLSKQDLFNKLLTSKIISRVIKEEVCNKGISYKKAQQNAVTLMKEIAANFSYEILRLTDRVLRFIWNRLFQKINVYNIKRVYRLVFNGHKIVYIPCHRSHIDYLLLSYILYHQGLMPPYIAAGINLNFWPTGLIFRRLGAFFIRRKFKSNKFYSTVFREYLVELFNRGHSVEYFIEGRRSRTGRLLNPKTGILSVNIQAMLHDVAHPITLVPIYIGYECIIEINSYIKELLGTSKKKESLLRTLRSLSKLHNLGQGYINFGKPLSLVSWFNQNVPKWHKYIHSVEFIRPSMLTTIVNSIAIDLMVRINDSVVVNAMNLCCTALLSSSKRALTRIQLIKQLECYLSLMRNVPYTKDSIIPSVTANELINYVIQMRKMEVKKNANGDIIFLPREQEIAMTYYRNNIIHMLVLPSLIAIIIIKYHFLSHHKLLSYIKTLYPILKAELFLHWHINELETEVNKLVSELLRQGLISLKENKLLINQPSFYTLQLLASSIQEILFRYAVIFRLLSNNIFINRNTLKEKYRTLIQYLSLLHGINSLEFFDRELFDTLILTLRNEGYISSATNIEASEKIIKIYQILVKLVRSNERSMIEKICN